MQHRLSMTCRRASAVNQRNETKTHVGPAPFLDHPASVAGRPPAATFHRRTATAQIARRLPLILFITAKTPAEDIASVKTLRRERHRRRLVKTFDLLGEQVEGHRRGCRHAHGTSQDRHGVVKDIAMGISNHPAQCLRLAIPRQGHGGRPDTTRHSPPVNTRGLH